MDEWLAICHAFWGREYPVNYSGRFYRINEGRLNKGGIAQDCWKSADPFNLSLGFPLDNQKTHAKYIAYDLDYLIKEGYPSCFPPAAGGFGNALTFSRVPEAIRPANGA